MVKRATASCKTKHAMVENTRAQRSLKPKDAPALEAVVMVPGPIKAAEMTAQKSIFNTLFFKCFLLYLKFCKLMNG